MDPSNTVNPRLLVPILIAGAALSLTTVLVPGTLHTTWWARAIMLSTVAGAVAISVWVVLRGVSRRALFAVAIWGDVAITVGSLTMGSPAADRTSMAMYALPCVMVALYGSVRIMTVQALLVTTGAAISLIGAGLPTQTIVIQLPSALLASISPALAVLVLRRRLDLALRREQELGVTDPLTRAINRRGLEAAVPALVGRARTNGLPLGFVVIDIDHFKQINDRHGHRVGDLVLEKIAGIIRECVCPHDVVCRLGGEEFAVLAAASPEHLAVLSERIRLRVADQCVAPTVTVSVGATWCEPARDTDAAAVESVWAMIGRADELMYAAKRSGRNRSEFDATY